jgi:L-amino acid N-acyltransferase YncA
MIRAAEPGDAAAIAGIYNQGIEERSSTFETRLRTAGDFLDPGPPFLVAEDNGSLLGWARLARYNPRDCYAGVGEASVYVDRAARGRGLGRALFEALADEAEGLGYWKIVGGLFPDNEASRALCRAAGCREVGVFERHSRLDGEWRDVLYVERLIGPAQL